MHWVASNKGVEIISRFLFLPFVFALFFFPSQQKHHLACRRSSRKSSLETPMTSSPVPGNWTQPLKSNYARLATVKAELILIMPMFLTWFTFFVLKLGAYVKERNNNSCQKHNQILMLVVAVLLLSFRGQCVITLKAGGGKNSGILFCVFLFCRIWTWSLSGHCSDGAGVLLEEYERSVYVAGGAVSKHASLYTLVQRPHHWRAG